LNASFQWLAKQITDAPVSKWPALQIITCSVIHASLQRVLFRPHYKQRARLPQKTIKTKRHIFSMAYMHQTLAAMLLPFP